MQPARGTSCRFRPVAGSEAFLRMASPQTAERIIQSIRSGDIRRAHSDRLKDGTFLKAFRLITDDWKLTNAQRGAPLGVSVSTYRRWRAQPSHLTDEQLLRISYLLNIYLDLQAIFDSGDETDTSVPDSWVKNTSHDFGNRTPIDDDRRHNHRCLQCIQLRARRGNLLTTTSPRQAPMSKNTRKTSLRLMLTISTVSTHRTERQELEVPSQPDSQQPSNGRATIFMTLVKRNHDV